MLAAQQPRSSHPVAEPVAPPLLTEFLVIPMNWVALARQQLDGSCLLDASIVRGYYSHRLLLLGAYNASIPQVLDESVVFSSSANLF